MWTGFFPLIVLVQNLHETWASAVKLAQAPPLRLSLFFLPVPILTPQLVTPPVANKYLWLGGDYIWRGFGCWSWHRGTTAGLPALGNSYWNLCTTWWGKVVPKRPGPLHLAAGRVRGKWGARGNPKQAAKERFVRRELLVDAVMGHVGRESSRPVTVSWLRTPDARLQPIKYWRASIHQAGEKQHIDWLILLLQGERFDDMTCKNNMLFSTAVYSKGKSQKDALMRARGRVGIDPAASLHWVSVTFLAPHGLLLAAPLTWSAPCMQTKALTFTWGL